MIDEIVKEATGIAFTFIWPSFFFISDNPFSKNFYSRNEWSNLFCSIDLSIRIVPTNDKQSTESRLLYLEIVKYCFQRFKKEQDFLKIMNDCKISKNIYFQKCWCLGNMFTEQMKIFFARFDEFLNIIDKNKRNACLRGESIAKYDWTASSRWAWFSKEVSSSGMPLRIKQRKGRGSPVQTFETNPYSGVPKCKKTMTEGRIKWGRRYIHREGRHTRARRHGWAMICPRPLLPGES